MVYLGPSADKRNRLKALVIRLIDIGIYALVLVGGMFILILTPEAIERQLSDLPWLIMLWSVLLILGGLLGLLGRLTGRWWVEAPGTVISMFGALIYAIVLLGVWAGGERTLVPAAFALVAFLTLVRRYVELQLFTSEPGDVSLTYRIRKAVSHKPPTAHHN